MTRSYFDPSFPPEQQTAQFWEDVLQEAIALKLLKDMETGRVDPGTSWD